MDIYEVEATYEELFTVLASVQEKDGKRQFAIPRVKKQAFDLIRKCVINGDITRDSLIHAIQLAEENGNQHIFYFAPTSDKLRELLDNGELIASTLFGRPDWREAMGFPRIASIPGGSEAFLWADFRVGVEGKPRDWVAKIYDREVGLQTVPDHELSKWMKEYNVEFPQGWKFETTKEVPYFPG